MNKAEKVEMDALRIRLALTWPPEPPNPVDLAVASLTSDSEWLHLWWMNPRALMVGRGVTNGSLHSVSDYTDAQLKNRWGQGVSVSLSQGGGGPWFDSEVAAYRALQYAAAQECAGLLHNLAERTRAAAEQRPLD